MNYWFWKPKRLNNNCALQKQDLETKRFQDCDAGSMGNGINSIQTPKLSNWDQKRQKDETKSATQQADRGRSIF